MEMPKIPNGKNDKPFLILFPENREEILYDITERNGELYMLDHAYEGCVTFPFSKPVRPECGTVLLDGIEMPYVVKEIPLIQNMMVTMLGVKLRGRLSDYGKTVQILVKDFCDYDGNIMEPVTVAIRSMEKEEPRPEYAEHEKIALQAAEEGIVLLKNEGGVLPLSPKGVWNVFGKGIYDFRTCAVGAGKINPRYSVDFREAVSGREDLTLNSELEAFYRCDEDKIPDQAMIQSAKKQSDTAIFILTRASGENMDNSTDRGEFYLSADEEALLKELRQTFSYLVVILNVGYPVSICSLETCQADAVVYCGFGGMLAGEALLRVLTGETNPSGRLTGTWVFEYEDLPSANNFYDCRDGLPRYSADSDAWIDTVYEEGIYVGYRYFETFGIKAAYPFGYGLSYTKFRTEIIECSYIPAKGLHVEAKIKNIGELKGKEVLQIYVKKPDGRLEQPERELIAFEKTECLEPEEEQMIRCDVPLSHFTSYEEESAVYVMEEGEYQLYVGSSAASTEWIGKFYTERQVISQTQNRMIPQTSIEELSKRARKTEKDEKEYGRFSGVKENRSQIYPERICPGYPLRFVKEQKDFDKEILFQDVLEDKTLLETYVSGLSISDLCRLTVCAGDGWGMEGTGEAGRIAQLEKQEIPTFVVADGNSGVNMRKKNIGMPSGVTLCSSFNKKLMGQVGEVIGEEAKELGIDLILAPAFNIQRNPLCGRHPEYFSEDPILSGEMAAAYAKGLEKTGVGACYKHLLANNAEASRKKNQSILSERALREIYFKAFETALEYYQPVSVMTAYNAVNGRFASEDADLIQGLLREEMQFDGFVMTDWSSYDTADIVKMENAGNNWLTPGGSDPKYPKLLEEAVKNGQLEEDRLRENVWYLLKTVLKLKGKQDENECKKVYDV